MEWWQSLVMGIVEGLTEYLPISSTAHLILTQRLLGIPDSDGVKAFEVVIQAGAILAVVGVFARRVHAMILGLLGKSPEGLRLAIRLLVAFIPTAALGLAFNEFIKKRLFSLNVIAIAWIVGGIVILAVERWRRRTADRPRLELSQLSLGAAFTIGLMQSLGMCPGVSRSFATLLGGLLVGLSFTVALEFSFLLGGITLLAAAGYDGLKHRHEILATASPFALAVGCVAAAAAAFLCVRWMLRSLERLGLAGFGWYRIAMGLIVGGLILSGQLSRLVSERAYISTHHVASNRPTDGQGDELAWTDQTPARR